MRGLPTTATPYAGRSSDAAEIAVARCNQVSPDTAFQGLATLRKSKCLERDRSCREESLKDLCQPLWFGC